MNLEQLYRQVIMDHYKNPHNRGFVADNSYMTVHLNNPSCGDEMTVQLKIENGIISDIKQKGTGCSICCSSASVMSVTLMKKTVDEAIAILNQFYELIKGYPFDKTILSGDALAYQGVAQFPARVKCATLAWKAAEKAIQTLKEDPSHG